RGTGRRRRFERGVKENMVAFPLPTCHSWVTSIQEPRHLISVGRSSSFPVKGPAPMSETTPKNNAHCSIPGDPEQSINRFIVVAAKRARQLQGGARSFLPTSSKKATTIAMEEVRRYHYQGSFALNCASSG